MNDRTVDPSLVTYVHIMYALHALAAIIGITTAATVVGNFIFGLPSIIAVIMNYVKRADARGTWLESHFRWQLRTFWFAVLWVAVIGLLSLPFMLVIIGFVTFGIGVALIGLWLIYRVTRGWLTLREGRPMALPAN